MATADIVARLRLNGEQFSQEVRSRFGELEGQARSSADRLGASFAKLPEKFMPPADFARMFQAGQQAANRLQASVDPLFASQQRYNRAVQELNELQVLGFATGQRYLAIHAGLTQQYEAEMRSLTRLGGMNSATQQGFRQLSFQANDFVTSLAAGAPAQMVFVQQMGQTIQAVQMMGGESNAFIRFLNTGWGMGFATAIVALIPFIAKLFDMRSELQKATDDLAENARKADLTRQAQIEFGRTLPGIEQAIRSETDALRQQNSTLRENQELTLQRAQNRNAALEADRATNLATQARLTGELRDAERALAAIDREAAVADPALGQQLAGMEARVQQLRQQLADARAENARIQGDIAGNQAAIREADIAREHGESQARLHPAIDATNRLADAVARLDAEYRAGGITLEVYKRRLDEINRVGAAQIEQARRTEEDRRRQERQANRDYSQVPFSEVRSRIIANEAGPSVGGYNALAYNRPGGGNLYGVHSPSPLITMTIGEILDFQRNVMRPLTRGRRGPNDVGSTGAGAYQFESGTLAENARLAFGPDWRSVMFSPGNQDRIAETLYNRVRGNPTMLRNTWAAFQPGHGGSGGDSAAAANAAAQAAEQEAQSRERILQGMRAATDQAVQQARLGDMRAAGLDREASLEEDLNRKRAEAAQRIQQLQVGVEQMRRGGNASPEDIRRAEAAVAAQQNVTDGLEEQLRLYGEQSAAYARMLVQHREDGKLTKDEIAAERQAAEEKQQTLDRAAQLIHTSADQLKFAEATTRAEHATNDAIDDGNQKRERTQQLAQQLEAEQQRILDDMKQQMMQRQEDQFRQLADLYRDLFDGRTGDIVDRFKHGMLDAIAEIAAAWTLSQISGQQFNLGGTLQGMQGNPIASLLGGLFGGGKGGALSGDAATMAWANPFGGGSAAGAGGLMSGIGSAVPYVAAAAAAFSLLNSLGVFSSTKRGSSTLGFDGGELGAGATRGNSRDYIAASSSAMDSVGGSLERIAEMLGGTVTGAGSVSLGQRDGNWRGDPTGRGITKTKKGAIDFGDDQEAAIRWAIGEALRDGVIGGISDAAKAILQKGKDLDKAIEKAVMIESIPKLLKGRLDPVGAALDELDDKWKKMVAALKEGGATAEQFADAQKLYQLELQETIDKTASASSTLKEFLQGLQVGPNSPYSLRDQETQARAAMQPFLDRIAAGESIDQDKYQAAAQAFLDIERQLYGSTGQFFEAMDTVMAATSKAIDRIDSAVPIRTAVDPFVEATANNTGTMTEQLEGLQALPGQNNQIIELLGTIVGALQNGDGFVGRGTGFSSARAL